jgi:hypothetical protein
MCALAGRRSNVSLFSVSAHLHVHRLARALALALFAGDAAATVHSVGTEAELVQAIDDANANAGADTIDITANIALSAALPTITDALTLEGASGVHYALARDDSGTNACAAGASNAFRLIDATADLTLRDLTLSGGCNFIDAGGAARVSGAQLLVERSTITGNHTVVEGAGFGLGGLGGGIAVQNGSATLTDTTVTGNSTSGAYSGGGGVAVYNGSLTLTGSTVSGNASNGLHSSGGGLYFVGDYPDLIAGPVTISNTVVTSNSASGDSVSGGGLYSLVSTLTITGSAFTANEVAGGASTHGNGGGIHVSNAGDPSFLSSIDRTTIGSNAITSGEGGEGAGLFVEGGSLMLTESSVIDNSVSATLFGFGGGIEVFAAPATVINSTISGNRLEVPGAATAGRGGGIMLYGYYAYETSLSMSNSTIAGNIVEAAYSRGGGVRFQSYGDPGVSTPPSALFESTIIAGNSADDGGAIQIEDSPDVVANHCLIEGTIEINPGIGGMFTPDATTTALLGMDALLQPLAYNGGVTMTQALDPASPAIDQGTNPQAAAFDQRGAPYERALGAATDIGAYELDTDRIFAAGFD